MLNLAFHRADAHTVPTHVLFGKLPNRPDFVRVNVNHPVALEFDRLIQRGLEKMLGEPGVADAFELAGPVDFQYVSQDRRQVMVGVLVPSQDSAGRLYPFVAAAILPRELVDGYLPVLPIAYEVFFDGLREQAVNAVENSVEALSCRQFLESSLRGPGSADEDMQLAQSVVQRFMLQEPAGRIAELLETGANSATLHQALLNIAFYQDYLRRFNNSAINQIILLPLSEAKGEQSLLASAWLSLLSALWTESASCGSRWCGSYLISRRRNEGAQLIASVGSIPDSFVNVMLGGRRERDMLLDLGAEHDAWRSHRMYAEASYALGRVLSDPDFRLSMLFNFLGDMSRQLEANQ